jgi:endonuclease/exonuclease/phosphatase family metal-dependent hydrolase
MTNGNSGCLELRQARPDSLRILSWNIERGLQLPKILDFLRAIDADLLLLQEVDLNARRTRRRDIASDLARALNLNYAFGMEFQELSEGTAASPAYHGMATLTRWPLLRARVIRFRDQSAFWKPRWFVPDIPVFQRRLGGRIALVTETTIHARKVVSYNLHLESRGNDALRLRQLNEVLGDCGGYVDQPLLVIGGDFNLQAGDGGVAKALRAAGFHDAVRLPKCPTTTAHHPRAIDWIFVSATLDSEGRVHNDIHASDHFPVSTALVGLPSGKIECDRV